MPTVPPEVNCYVLSSPAPGGFPPRAVLVRLVTQGLPHEGIPSFSEVGGVHHAVARLPVVDVTKLFVEQDFEIFNHQRTAKWRDRREI